MKPLITLILFLLSYTCFAQKQNVYFLKNDGRYVNNKDSADYIRIVREPDSASVLFNVFEYYANGKEKSIGQSSTIDPPNYEGQMITYYKNGKKHFINDYKNGVIIGNSYEYYPNGKPYLVRVYSDRQDRFKEVTEDYSVKAESDSLGNVMIADGSGYFVEYNSAFNGIVDEGNIKNGKRDGIWKGYDGDLKLSFHELYDNGKLIYGVSTLADGDSVKYKKNRNTPPQYSGGIPGFADYLRQNIVYPTFEKEHGIQGHVIVSFVVEPNGTISNIRVLTHVSDNIDKEAIRVIQKSADWRPGTKYGRKVRAYITQPLNFSLGNN